MTKKTNLLRERANDTALTKPQLEIHSLDPEDDPTPFRTLNEEWISQYFELEEKDREVLGNPTQHILKRGGQIFILYANGEPVGCVALISAGNGVFELSKMTITTRMRGVGLGRRLLGYVIARAREIGAKSLFLGSNTKLQNAIHLYEAIGFRYIEADRIPRSAYARENVFMELLL